MSFIPSFFSKLLGSSCLGVDIGTTSIKMVELSRGGSGFRLNNYGLLESYGHLERLNDAIQTSSLKLFEKETIKLLKILLQKVKPNSNKVIASIPPFSSFVTLLELPLMGEGETAKAVPFQARQYIPLPLEEVALDWVKVGEREEEDGSMRQQVLLISVLKEQIRKYQIIFKEAGLNLVALEIEGLALTRVLIAGDTTPTIIADIGSRSTNILVVDQGFMKLQAQTDLGGGVFTQAISSGLHIDVRRAEELKKQRGIVGGAEARELSTLMMPYLDAIILEVERLKNRYEHDFKGRIERVILSGGATALLGMEEYFKEQIHLPVIRANPFTRIDYPKNLEPIVGELGPSLAIAIGLAKRGLL